MERLAPGPPSKRSRESAEVDVVEGPVATSAANFALRHGCITPRQ
jgi:hypothetical protein